MDHVAGVALVRDLSFDTFGYELQLILDVLLQMASRGTTRHRADGTHAAIAIKGAAVVEERLARRVRGPHERRPDHHRRGPRRQGLCDVPARAKAAVCK